jgi:hypothetical protein
VLNFQCPGPNRSVQGTEVQADGLSTNPASLVTIQAGADDIGFGDCLLNVLTHGAEGSSCVADGEPSSAITKELKNVRSSLKSIIEQVSHYTKQIAVVDYYEPVPSPNDFDGSSSHSGTNVDPICLALQTDKDGAYNEGVIVTTALNVAIFGAIDDARKDGVKNVVLVDISALEVGHEMCTGYPALFSGEWMSASALGGDVADLLACKYGKVECKAAALAQDDIMEHTWRAAHPNIYGQQDIANAVLAVLNK